VKVLVGIGLLLVAIAAWIEIWLLVIQLATDSCSIGYCPVGHGDFEVVPYGPAAFVATIAVILLAGGVLFDRRLGKRAAASGLSRGPLRGVSAGIIAFSGIVVWFSVLYLLTWGQPFEWMAVPPPCVPPSPEMNLYCDTETSAELFHAYGPWALAIATGAGVLTAGVLLGVRRIVRCMRQAAIVSVQATPAKPS
jgi:hypothetical protein